MLRPLRRKGQGATYNCHTPLSLLLSSGRSNRVQEWCDMKKQWW